MSVLNFASGRAESAFFGTQMFIAEDFGYFFKFELI